MATEPLTTKNVTVPGALPGIASPGHVQSELESPTAALTDSSTISATTASAAPPAIMSEQQQAQGGQQERTSG
jgi:hypothetical protein